MRTDTFIIRILTDNASAARTMTAGKRVLRKYLYALQNAFVNKNREYTFHNFSHANIITHQRHTVKIKRSDLRS
jgi:hypothetical protein